MLLRLLKQVTANSLGIEVDKPTLEYVAQLATLLFNSQNREQAAWQDAIVPYLAPFFGDEGAEGVCSACLARCVGWACTRLVCGFLQTSLGIFSSCVGFHRKGDQIAATQVDQTCFVGHLHWCLPPPPKTLPPPLQNPPQGQPAD